MSGHTMKSRPNDYLYDSAFITSGSKDFYKHAVLAKQAMMKYAVCPIFPSMFSDLQNYPRKQYVIRRTAPVPTYVERAYEDVDSNPRSQLVGPDRYKYFHNAPAKQHQANITKLDMSCFYDVDKQKAAKVEYDKSKRNVKVQTMYRDAAVLTSPWQPDIETVKGEPELLKLDFLKWGMGLPAGLHEVAKINRNRNKRMWEQVIPEGTSRRALSIQRDMVEELDRTEWADRELDIEQIQALRMELLENMLNEIHVKSNCRSEKKLRMLVDRKLKEKTNKIAKIQKDGDREKRRLQCSYKGILQKYGKVDVFKEHADYKSELYCPLMRNGVNPKYGHEKLARSLDQYLPQFYKVEQYDTLPRDLYQRTHIGEIKLPGRRLCPKETKWTEPVLKALYNGLKELRQQDVKYPNLRICNERIPTPPPTPEVEESDRSDTELHESVEFMQNLLRGRATQNYIFKGREKCHELIDELRETYPLREEDVDKLSRSQRRKMDAQLIAKRGVFNMQTLVGSLKKLSGTVVGTLLEFLNKDLRRLLRERQLHAIILLIERMRQIREAEEAGRRQKEMRRRLEHDEIFKQIVKVQQETVDLYLQDIITEGMQFESEEQAQQYVRNMANDIIREQDALEKTRTQVEREEYIAEMVHDFLVPEVEKNIVRQRRKEKQMMLLKYAHDEIFRCVDNLPKPQSPADTSITTEIPTTSLASQDVTTIDEKQESTKQKSVMQDIQAIVEDLISAPVKRAVINRLNPCWPAEPTVRESDEREMRASGQRSWGRGTSMEKGTSIEISQTTEEEMKTETTESHVIEEYESVE